MTTKDLIKKYATKTPEEMVAEQDKLREDLTIQQMELDSKIRNFSTQVDPLCTNTGEVLAHVKRPSIAQLERLLPIKLLKYKDNPETIPPEEALAFISEIYKLMEELIVCPHHSAEEWKEMISDDFVAMFQAHILKIREEASKAVSRFLPQTTGSTN